MIRENSRTAKLKILTLTFLLVVLLASVVIIASCDSGKNHNKSPFNTATDGFYYGTPVPKETPVPDPPPENQIDPLSVQAGKAFAENSPTAKYKNLSHNLQKFLLKTKYNPNLPFNIALFIDESKASCVLPSGIDLTAIIPELVTKETVTEYLFNGKQFENAKTALDFSRPGTMTLKYGDGSSYDIEVIIETLNTGLPSFSMTVEDFRQVTSKDVALNCSIYAGGGSRSVCPYGDAKPVMVNGTAEGRGNSSWWWDFPKRSYTIRFDQKTKLLGLDSAKSYVITTCLRDRSLLRNYLMTEIGRLLDMEFNMETRIVDFWLNGKYWGVYTLEEKIVISKSSVDLPEYDTSSDPSKIGYLLEWDGHAQEVPADQKAKWRDINGVKFDAVTGQYIITFDEFPEYNSMFLTIQSPGKKHLTSEMCKYVYDYMYKVMLALHNENYKEFDKYADVESFVKWYFAEELTVNTDAKFWTSCWMYIDGKGELSMGPLWDFDKCLGNNGKEYYKYYISETPVYEHLNNMKAYTELVQSMWKKYKDDLLGLKDYIDKTAKMLSRAQVYDMRLDDSLWVQREYHEKGFTFTTYEKEISDIKDFIDKRVDFMDTLIFTNYNNNHG